MENHDTIIKHGCEIDELRGRDAEILGRFDQQDVDYEKFKAAIFNKLDRTMWYVFTALISALLSGLIYVVFIKH